MSSSRLPGKVLMPFGDTTVLGSVIRRARASCVQEVIVATSIREDDNPITEEAHKENALVFRGDLLDVLGRYADCAQAFDVDHIVRLTADCPLVPAKIISLVVAKHIRSKADYTSNVHPRRTYPKGWDVEVITREALLRCHNEATSRHDREHVTTYIRDQKLPGFTTASMESSLDMSSRRLCIDTADDYEVLSCLA